VARAADALARWVPADVGLYAEIREAGDLLSALTDPQIWSTLAELVGQPAQPDEVARWRERIRQTVRMEPEEAIRVLFAGGVAFVGEGLGLAHDATVLCRPAAGVSPQALLEKWEARRVLPPERPQTYRLLGSIDVAEFDGLLCFGDPFPPNGFFRQMQQFAADPQARSLADDPVYRQLLARVGDEPTGVLFLRLARAAPLPVPSIPPGSQPGSQPASAPVLPNLGGPLRGAQNVLFALHRQGPLLRFTVVSDGKPEAIAAAPLKLAERLPRQTLLAWEGLVDYVGLGEKFKELPQGNFLRGVFELPQQVDALERFIRSLGADTCLAVGPVLPQGRAPGAPPVPALAILLETRDPAQAAEGVLQVVRAGMAAYLVFAFQRGLPLLEPIRQERLGENPVSVLELSPLLKAAARSAVGEVHCCWTIHDGTLIVASHRDWLREIIAARSGQVGTLGRGPEPMSSQPAGRETIIIALESGPLADIGARWLDYLRSTRPEVFDERWWRERQPGGGEVRLGINVTPEPEHKRLRVNEVLPNGPAKGWLQPGDFIVGYENRRFATDDIVAETRTALSQRPHARWVELLIERGGQVLRKRVPLPFINPLEALQRAVAIARIAERVTYRDDYSDVAGPRGYLTVELRTGAAPPRPQPPGP